MPACPVGLGVRGPLPGPGPAPFSGPGLVGDTSEQVHPSECCPLAVSALCLRVPRKPLTAVVLGLSPSPCLLSARGLLCIPGNATEGIPHACGHLLYSRPGTVPL